jgi:hypothetical protein
VLHVSLTDTAARGQWQNLGYLWAVSSGVRHRCSTAAAAALSIRRAQYTHRRLNTPGLQFQHAVMAQQWCSILTTNILQLCCCRSCSLTCTDVAHTTKGLASEMHAALSHVLSRYDGTDRTPLALDFANAPPLGVRFM